MVERRQCSRAAPWTGVWLRMGRRIDWDSIGFLARVKPVLPMVGAMPRIDCRYCLQIRRHAPRYQVRPATHATHSTFPRCDWHWRFVCEKCGRSRHFHGIAYCERNRRLFCLYCAPEHRAPRRGFWGWSYSYRMRCPWRSEWHGALDRLEYDHRHPWQLDPAWRQAKRGMSHDEHMTPGWSFRVEPLEGVSDEHSRKGWDAVARWWISRYTPKGDVNREWVIDPALFRLLGDIRGRRVLDAGCGTGYLSRLLAAQGATVVGIDLSSRLLAEARAQEANEPLGVDYYEGNLADLSRFPEGTFDMIVSNVVMGDVVQFRQAFREFHRVLQPSGRLLFSVTHPCFERPVPGSWVREPPDSERVEEWRGLLVDRYYDRVAVWWGPARQESAVGFHRTLEDYVSAVHEAGFWIARMEEPRPTKEAVARRYRDFADYSRVPLFLIVEAIRPAAPIDGNLTP
jgi:2-polyprenyl-3-methyl-5-hydroxy-6-metoxy-1,4-benzoquinol methylase